MDYVDLRNNKLIKQLTLTRFFEMDHLVEFYRAYCDLTSLSPTCIVMTKDQLKMYGFHLMEMSKLLGLPIPEENLMTRRWTYRGVQVTCMCDRCGKQPATRIEVEDDYMCRSCEINYLEAQESEV